MIFLKFPKKINVFTLYTFFFTNIFILNTNLWPGKRRGIVSIFIHLIKLSQK